MMRHALGVIFLFILGSAQAAPVTIDFEEFSVGAETTLFSQGYTIKGEAYQFDPGPCCNAIIAIGDQPLGSKQLEFFSFNSVDFSPGPRIFLDVERTDGTAFALYSIDIGGDFAEIQGTRATDGQIITGTVGDLGSGDWLAITSFRLDEDACVCGGFGIALEGYADNIVVGAAVPVPAAVWLFGSALAGLGWMRRKQTI
jgi:hypothetical protein